MTESDVWNSMNEGDVCKGGQNPPNTSDVRPPVPDISAETALDKFLSLDRKGQLIALAALQAGLASVGAAPAAGTMSSFADGIMIMADIDFLRQDEGDSVQILCDNPEEDKANRVAAVEVSADWTDWKPERFYGPTWQVALHKAAHTRRRRETIYVGGKPQHKFRIRNKAHTGEALYWSNVEGWISECRMVTLFSAYERQTLNLPLEGEWEQVGDSKEKV